ncbi:MAG: class I SAM-dependent methyltransferase [Gemmatimonadaceae bacterium]|nr:class I SAM-dependent methyltransferase [Gemmatimonadaceae bacterium]
MRRLVPLSTRRLLDVGCGRGDFGRALRAERPGLHVSGLELTDWASVASTHLDDVRRLDIERDDLGGLGQFDCITFNDVLEHLVDPWAALRRVLDHLQPGGFVIASSPNMRHMDVLKSLLLDKRFDYADSGVMDRTHLRFFTMHTFPEMFSAVGLQVQETGGLENHFTFPWKFRLLNMLLLGALHDARFMQLYCVARKPPA